MGGSALQVTRGYVIAHREPADRRRRLFLACVANLLPYNHDEFDLPIDFARQGREHYRIAVAYQGACELGEHCWVLRDGGTYFLNVFQVVLPYANERWRSSAARFTKTVLGFACKSGGAEAGPHLAQFVVDSNYFGVANNPMGPDNRAEKDDVARPQKGPPTKAIIGEPGQRRQRVAHDLRFLDRYRSARR